MRPITLPPSPLAATPFERYVIASLQEIERASQEDPAQIFDSYSSNAVPTLTRILNVSAPSTANVVALLYTLIEDWRARGVNRTGPT